MATGPVHYDSVSQRFKAWLSGALTTLDVTLLAEVQAALAAKEGVAVTAAFTPVDASGAGLTFVFASGIYVKVGGLVMAHLQVIYPVTANAAQAKIGGLPFTVNAAGNTALATGYISLPADLTWYALAGGSQVIPAVNHTGGAVANSALSGGNMIIGGTYKAA